MECDHTFVEEMEPDGRLILPPCINCGMTAVAAIEALKKERDDYRRDANIARNIAARS